MRRVQTTPSTTHTLRLRHALAPLSIAVAILGLAACGADENAADSTTSTTESASGDSTTTTQVGEANENDDATDAGDPNSTEDGTEDDSEATGSATMAAAKAEVDGLLASEDGGACNIYEVMNVLAGVAPPRDAAEMEEGVELISSVYLAVADLMDENDKDGDQFRALVTEAREAAEASDYALDSLESVGTEDGELTAAMDEFSALLSGCEATGTGAEGATDADK